MKKQMLFFVLLMLGVCVSAHAQADAKLTSGVVAHNARDFEKALKYLDQALEEESQLKAKNVPKAWYYKGKSLIGAMTVAAQDKDMPKLELYANAPLDAFQCFKQAIAKDDEKKKYEKMAKLEMSQIYNLILQSGLAAMNTGSHEQALKNLDAAAEIGQTALDQDYYVTYDLRAQTYISLKDSTKAAGDFDTAIQLFKDFPPANPDLLVAYVYYRKALLQRYHQKDLDAALATLDQGKQMLETEWERLQQIKDKLTPEQMTDQQQQYDDARQDLNSFELDILINSPEKLQQALAKFEKAIVDQPDDYIVHVAYASLLEKQDINKAIKMYEKAIAIDPEKQIAHFNLGAIYVNKAAELAKKANETTDNDLYNKLFTQMQAEFKSALPHMEKSHQLDPKDGKVLSTLMTITLNLEMTEEYNAYKAKKDAL